MEDYLAEFDASPSTVTTALNRRKKRANTLDSPFEPQGMSAMQETPDDSSGLAAARAAAEAADKYDDAQKPQGGGGSSGNGGMSPGGMKGFGQMYKALFGNGGQYGLGGADVGGVTGGSDAAFTIPENMGGWGMGETIAAEEGGGTLLAAEGGGEAAGGVAGGEGAAAGAGTSLFGSFGWMAIPIAATAFREYFGGNSGTQILSGSIHEDWHGVGNMMDEYWPAIGDALEGDIDLAALSEPGFWTQTGFPLGYGSGMGGWDPFGDVAGWFGVSRHNETGSDDYTIK